MHRQITEAIKEALTKTQDQRMSIIIYPKVTDGFWKMKIVLKPKFKHMTKHIELIALHIGRFYGEGLWINVKGRTIIVS